MRSTPLFEFESFPKLTRLTKTMIITEKLDGTNAQVVVEDIGEAGTRNGFMYPKTTICTVEHAGREYALRAGSRNKYLIREADNFGFAKFVEENAHELVKLGEGRHFGEWWGSGINKRYGSVLEKGQRFFSLFNVGMWRTDPAVIYDQGAVPERVWEEVAEGKQALAPKCCRVVPILDAGPFDLQAVHAAMDGLRMLGSVAAPGCMNPEGVIVFYEGHLFKHTFEFPFGKWQVAQKAA